MLSVQQLQNVAVTEHYQRLGRTVVRNFGVNTYFTFDDAYAAAERKGQYPRNEIENLWIDVRLEKPVPKTYVLTSHWYRYDINPSDYWNTLDLTANPHDYIDYLKLYKPGGIALRKWRKNYIPWYADKPREQFLQGPAVQARETYIPRAITDRKTYALYIRRLGERLKAYYLPKTIDIAKISSFEDLNTLQDVLSTAVNAQLPGLIAYAQTAIPYTIYKPGNNQTIKTESAAIPADSETGPEIDYGGSMLTALQAVIYEIQKAQDLYRRKLTDLAARIAQLRDSRAVVPTRPELLDPTKNPFLVYDEIASEKAGVPIYKNLAVSEAATETPKQVTTEEIQRLLPSLQHYQLAPEQIADVLRTVPLEHGGSVSNIDLIRAGVGSQNNTALIAGAVAAALLLSQFTG